MYKYYQPNEKDLKDAYGDCTIRAFSKALNKNWIDTFKLLIDYQIKYQCPIGGMTLDLYKKVLKDLGFEYKGISNKKGSKRPTVKSFAKEHTQGTYILSVSNHFVCCTDGNYYDTWDCGSKSLYGYYEKINY